MKRLLTVVVVSLGILLAQGQTRPDGARAAPPGPLQPRVILPDRYDTWPALRDISPGYPAVAGPLSARPRLRPPRAKTPASSPSAHQDWHGALGMPLPDFNFDGINNVNGWVPPDTQGDIGYDPASGKKYYIQWVNTSYAIWDVTSAPAVRVYGPAAGNNLWTGFGGACETSNDGDPITLYDPLAGRWFMSQFALPNYPNGPFFVCIAVSQTGDPTGAWHRYAYRWKNGSDQDVMNDYPKFGVWPDSYYMTTNQFASGTLAWRGVGVAAFERAKMLQGQAAQMIRFDLYTVNPGWDSLLPADLDGSQPPPAGAPNVFANWSDSSWLGDANDALRLWEFAVDWTTPANSTFGVGGQPNAELVTSDVDPNLCDYVPNCIPQPGGAALDAIAGQLMHRLAYRNRGDYEVLIANHTIDVGGDHAGIRWFELRKSGGAWSLHQTGTYAPDSHHRWMGSLAMDHAGNLALGYSVSSSTVYPSVRYAGRLAGDPPGVLAQGEVELVAGAGFQQSSSGRWGDYSAMSVDPVDDCTFWYTQEYYASTSTSAWRTRIGSFRFPGCTDWQSGRLAGIVSNAATGAPIAGASVRASASPTRTFDTASGASGAYTLNLPGGLYMVTAAAYGYDAAQATNVPITYGVTTTRNFALAPAASYVVSGVVSDAAAGWPLYASLTIAGSPTGTIWTDPVSGRYTVTLAAGRVYTFDVHAWVSGYQPASRLVGPLAGPQTQEFALDVDGASCSAPGYRRDTTCAPQPGGLAVGNVYDANTAAPLAGASVRNDAGYTATSAPAADPGVDDSFYTLFSPAGAHLITATLSGGYGADVRQPTVVQSDTVHQDLHLPAGLLNYTPPGLHVTLEMGQVAGVPFTLTNAGGLTATFELIELALAPARLGPFELPEYGVKPFKQNWPTARPVRLPDPPSLPPYPAGAVRQTWPSGLAAAWGMAFDAGDGTVWVGSPAPSWGGDNALHNYTSGGAPTGRSLAFAWDPPYGPADAAFNWNTGRLWVTNVDTDGHANCIYELDPTAGYTGRRICPGASGLAATQRGLAYDPAGDAYFVGGWNDLMIHHLTADGALLDEVNVGLGISGLAYNPDTRHLFVMTSDAPTLVYVLDAANSYAALGQFSVVGLSDYGGAGLELDCGGNLWTVDYATGAVYQFASGEATSVCAPGVAWLSEQPVTGALPAAVGQRIDVTFDAASTAITQPGDYKARIRIDGDTPYPASYLPVTMTVKPSPNWGKLTGAITSRGYCDAEPASLAGAAVSVKGRDGVTWTLTAGVGGAYALWLDPAHGPLTVTVSRPGHVTQAAAPITVTAGQTTTRYFGLRLDAPCVSVSPGAFDVRLSPHASATLPLTVANAGAAALSYGVTIYDGVVTAAAWLSAAPPSGSVPADSAAALDVTFDASALAPGVYTGSLSMASSDARRPLILTPVTLTVVLSYGVALDPPVDARQGEPGETLTYTLRLTNTGNVVDTFDLSGAGNAWDARFSITRAQLAAGAGVNLSVWVTVPVTATDGLSDTLRVEAVGTGVSDTSLLTTTAVVPPHTVYLPIVVKQY